MLLLLLSFVYGVYTKAACTVVRTPTCGIEKPLNVAREKIKVLKIKQV